MNERGIKIIGVQNDQYHALYGRLKDAIKSLSLIIQVDEENNINNIISNTNFRSLPALSINDKVVLQVNGKLPEKRELINLLKQNFKSSDLIQSILVPVDFTSHSGHALKYAAFIGKTLKAKLDVINVVEPSFDENNVYYTNILQEMLEAKSSHLKWFCKKHLGQKPELLVHLKTLVGKVKDQIVSYSKYSINQLIIISMNNEGSLLKKLIGSVTNFVYKHIGIDLLLIPPTALKLGLHNILFVVEDLEAEKRQIKNILKYGSLLGAKVHFTAYQNQLNKPSLEAIILKAITDLNMEVQFQIADENINQTKNSSMPYIDKELIDMVSFTHKPNSSLRQIFKQDVLKKYTPEKNYPLLILA